MYSVDNINLLNFSDDESYLYLQSLADFAPKKHLELMKLITDTLILRDIYGKYFRSEETIEELRAKFFKKPDEFTKNFYIDNINYTDQSSSGGFLVRSWFCLLFTNYQEEDLFRIEEHIRDNIRSL